MALLEQQSCFQLSWSAALIGPIDELKQMITIGYKSQSIMPHDALAPRTTGSDVRTEKVYASWYVMESTATIIGNNQNKLSTLPEHITYIRATTITCVLDIQGNFDGTKSKEPRPTTSCTTTSQQASK
eukprot:scaffold8234_cov116-Cylindrotheca_fusiformis.AAC.1